MGDLKTLHKISARVDSIQAFVEEAKKYLQPGQIDKYKQLSAAIQYRYHLSVPMPSVALGSVKTLKIRVSY